MNKFCTGLLLAGLLLCVPAAAQQADEAKRWITLDQQTYELLREIDPSVSSVRSRRVDTGAADGGADRVHVVAARESLLHALSRRVHEEQRHCAGYIAHDSLQDAEQALQGQSLVAAFTRPDYGITQQTVVEPMLAQQSAANIEQTILDLSGFRNRYYDGTYGDQASDWLLNRWSGLATGRADVTLEQVFRGEDRQASVVLRIEGSEYPEQVIVMGAHLDTVNLNGGSHETSRAPGADDDASGVAGLTEVLRVLLENGYRPQRSIHVMAYAGEEFGLLGSGYIADDYAARGIDVVGVLNLDMTNYEGSVGDIYLMEDYTDAGQNQFLEDLAAVYLPDLEVRRDRCGYACSDHASWNSAGYPASMPFESAMSDYNPNIHTSEDTYANAGGQATHSLKFSRLALAFAVELGEVSGGSGGGGGGTLENGVPVTGLSGAQGSETFFTIDVPSDASNLVFQMSGGSGDADLYVQYGSAPTTSSYDCRPYVGGNDEDCSFASPQAGTWHVMIRGYSSYSNVTLEASYDTGGGGGGGGGGSCPSGYTEYTGSLSGTGSEAYQPDGTYYYSGSSGTHSGVLAGPSGTDFDLYLQKWSGGRWRNVDSSLSGSSDESIDYSGSSGYYIWRIYSYSGSGSYTFCLSRP